MADLIETTLGRSVRASATQIALDSATGVNVGDVIFLDGEAMKVTAAPIQSTVRVMRGVEGTIASAHAAGVPAFIGGSARFYNTDPQGLAPAYPINNPWVNMRANRVWRAIGDQVGPEAGQRSWQLIATTYAVGALGVRLPPVSAP